MITMIFAAALTAQAPAAPAAADPMAHHEMNMTKGAEHKDMDCCKDCCKDMAGKHEEHGSGHADHSSR